MKCFLNFDTRTLSYKLQTGLTKSYWLFAILKETDTGLEIIELVDDYHEGYLPGEIRKVKITEYQVTRLSRGHGSRIVLHEHDKIRIKNS
jgi:hypothetical protein